MRRPSRRFTDREIAELRRLWPSQASDKQLVAWFDRTRTVLSRVACGRLGLPSRVIARSQLFEATKDQYRVVDA